MAGSTEVGVVCRNCSAANPSTNRFCGGCGAALAVAAVVPSQPVAAITVGQTPVSRRWGILLAFAVIILCVIGMIRIGTSDSNSATKFANSSAINLKGSSPLVSDSSSSTPPPALGSQWGYSTDQDAMGRSRSFATVTSDNFLNFGFPYGGTQSGRLTIRKTTARGTEIMVAIEKGQFVCGIEDCTVYVRFDNGPVMRFSADEPSDHSTTILFLENTSSFMAHLKQSKKVNVEATYYQEGNQSLQFNIENFRWPQPQGQ
jgi:hypothetical protein